MYDITLSGAERIQRHNLKDLYDINKGKVDEKTIVEGIVTLEDGCRRNSYAERVVTDDEVGIVIVMIPPRTLLITLFHFITCLLIQFLPY